MTCIKYYNVKNVLGNQFLCKKIPQKFGIIFKSSVKRCTQVYKLKSLTHVLLVSQLTKDLANCQLHTEYHTSRA